MAAAGLIRIDELTPSQNVLVRRLHNRYVYAKLRSKFQTWIMVGMANGKIAKATGRRRLTITRYVRSRRYLLDRGNFIGGCKPLLDAARLQGLIVDDTEALLDDHYVQKIDADPRVEILVEDL